MSDSMVALMMHQEVSLSSNKTNNNLKNYGLIINQQTKFLVNHPNNFKTNINNHNSNKFYYNPSLSQFNKSTLLQLTFNQLNLNSSILLLNTWCSSLL